DLGVVSEMAKRVVVMYAGAKIEEASVDDLFQSPLHPYTCGLLTASPRFAGGRDADGRRVPLAEIPGTVPPMTALPEGCRFAPRCALATDQCRTAPPFVQHRPGHWAACWRAGEMQAPQHG